MVKRLAVPIVILAAMLYCVPAFGAVAGTAHEQSIGDQGVCSACHIPHKALGARLWPQSMSGQEAVFGVVGSLCYYCHGTGGGAGLVNAVQIFAMDDTIGAFSHGRDVNQLPDPTGTMDTSLPYGGDSRFQCTTCHNVHDDTSKPFLQDDIDQLCARCHKLRQFVGGSDQAVQGAWGSGYYGTSNPGSHPMGTDVYGDSDSPANSPINITGAAVFTYAYGATSAHNLGGHLIDGATTPGSGAGVTCATCHSVHGVQTDADPPSGGTAPVANLLTIDQPTATGGFDNAQDGNGDPRNALCEGCHYTTATTIDASTGAAYGGSYRPNPGASAYTHPVDDLGASMEASVSAFPQYWPVSSSSATNVSPVPICESCHTPHPNANSNRANIVAASGTHILRAPEDDSLATYICFQCHDFTLGAGHHPSNVAMGRMGDSVIGNNDATLTCSDCHSGAHNWTTLGLGLDPQWEPAGNGRSRLSSVERVTAGASKECEDCHYNNNTIPCPTNNSTNGGGAVSHTWRTSTSYQDIGEGTHYLGTTTMDYALGSFGGSSFNATSDDWSGQGQANARWSRFDGSSGHVVCESCHDLEPDKNVPGTALLLAYYNDGGQGGNNDPSGLCEGCHGTSPGGTGTPHPMTGDTVSRTGVALTTTGSYTRGTIEGNATYPGSNALNCDSCHQPHDADTHGGTYIYDSGQNTSPTHDVTSPSQPGDSHVPTNRRLLPPADLEDASFCDSCHYYLQ